MNSGAAKTTSNRSAVLLFVALALVSRGCQLGAKPLHHDESLFGYYGYYLATTGHYEYDPILHGPLLIELTAGVFSVFGDNDFTLRLVPLLAGLALFPLLLTLRPWLGQHGTRLALLLLLASPNLCYYSRYQREDVLFLMLTLANVVAIAYTLRSDKAWPLVLWPVSLALLISCKENVVFVAASQIGFALLWIALDDRRIAQHRSAELAAGQRQTEATPPTTSRRLLGALKLINVSLVAWCLLAWAYALYVRPRVPLGWWASPLWLVGVVTTAVLLDIVLRAARHDRDGTGLVHGLYRRVYCDPLWCVSGLAMAVATACFCYSICLTQPKPILSLLNRAVTYWWGEHASQRLGGPFHCYAPQILLYEIPAWGIVLAALVRDWRQNRRARHLELWTWLLVAAAVWIASVWPLPLEKEDQSVTVIGPVTFTAYHWLNHRLRDSWPYLHLKSMGELLWAFTVLYWGMIWTVRSIRAGRLVRGWLIFWAMSSYLAYGYAGEKVPWLALHVLLPLWLLAAVLWEEWRAACPDRRTSASSVEPRRGFVTALVAALLCWSGWQTYLACFAHPTNPAELLIFNHTQPETARVAATVNRWITSGAISQPSDVVVQGEPSWPLTWYFRRSPVRFVTDDYRPTATDVVAIGNTQMSERSSMLDADFRRYYFPLRSAWVPPSISFNRLLGLKHVWNEPLEGLGAKLRYRAQNSAQSLRTLGQFILFRRPFGQLPSPPGDQAFGTVYSGFWVRERPTPEPLLPPP